MSENSKTQKVRVQRWPSPMGPVVGPHIIVLDIETAAEKLAVSGFMKPWIEEQIRTHLMGGGCFQNKGLTKRDDEEALVPNGEVLSMRVRSEYRLATEGEMLDYVDSVQYAEVTGRTISKRSQEKGYLLHYHEGVALIKAYESLPKQARVILDLLNATGREQFTEASVTLILSENTEALATRQAPDKIWGFYRRRLIDEGHVEEVEVK